jgi:hypothetical protein
MAFYAAQPARPIAEGQFTSTIYGLIKDQKFAEAIQHLQYQLQVGRRPRGARCRGHGLTPQLTSWLLSPCRTSLRAGRPSLSLATATTTLASMTWRRKCTLGLQPEPHKCVRERRERCERSLRSVAAQVRAACDAVPQQRGLQALLCAKPVQGGHRA